MNLLAKENTFAGEQFVSQLKVLIFFSIIQYISVFFDNVISGQLLGEEALAGIMLINSLISLGSFVAVLPAAGSVIFVNIISGLADNDRVEKIYSEGLILAVGMGGLLSIIYMLLRGHLTLFISAQGAPLEYANQYFYFISVLPIFQSLSAFLYAHVINQGENNLCALGAVVQMVSNVILSYVFCKMFGISGVALGTIISNILFALVMLKYFTREHHLLHFHWYFNWKSAGKMLKESLYDAFIFLDLAIMEYCLTNFISSHFGEQNISILAIVCSLLGFFVAILAGPGGSAESFILIYHTENNQHGILKTMRAANRAAAELGIGIALVIFILAPQIVNWFGIDQGALVADAVWAVRASALIPLFLSFIVLYCAYLVYSGKMWYSCFIMFVTLFAMLMGLSLVGSLEGGIRGLWVGFALSFALSFVIGALVLRWQAHENNFPLMLNPEEMSKEITYDLPFSTAGIGQALDLLERDLKARNIDDRALYKTLLLFEETEALALKRTNSANATMEINVKIEPDKLILILRDSGTYSDVTDVDGKISSFECYTAYRLIDATNNKKFFLTSGYNRTIYHIPRTVMS